MMQYQTYTQKRKNKEIISNLHSAELFEMQWNSRFAVLINTSLIVL